MSRRISFDIPDLNTQNILSQDEAYIEFRPKFMRVRLVYEGQRPEEPAYWQSWTSVIDRTCVKGYDLSRLPTLKRWQVDVYNSNGGTIVQLYFTHEAKAKKLASEIHKYIFGEDYIDIQVDATI